LADTTEFTLAALIREQSIRQPDAPAILAPGRPALSFSGLSRQVAELAAALHALGVTPSTRVAVVLPNGPEMASVFLGTAACSVCAPLNPAYQAAELRFYLQDLRAQVVIVSAGERGPVVGVARELGLSVLEIAPDTSLSAGQFRVAVPPVARAVAPPQWPGASDLALILHTSGTTARPKIVPLSQANLVASARNIARHLELQPSDRCLNVMPLFHIHGLVGALLASVAGGGSIVCTPGFDDREFFRWTAQFDPTWYTAVPTIHQAVVANGARYREQAPKHRFRLVRSSSASLPPKVFERLHELTGAPVIEAYGMTEASHQMASNPLPPAESKPGSVGIPAGADIAIMDTAGQLLPEGSTGEIVIRGPGVTAGYENNPQANADSFTHGWFRTGDQGRFDAQGYLVISGRLKEIVNRGGDKISPREIDEALLEHPDIAQAVAFAVPHPTLGEDLAAAVVMRDGAAADEEEVRGFLFERIAEFKVPSSIVFVDSIPKGPTGKVQRTSLHSTLGSRMASAFVSPRTELERSLEAILGEVLGCGAIGVHDNFFVLGGDSLKGTQVIARINARHDVALPIPALFRHPTIAALALEVGAAQTASAIASDELAAQIAAMSDEEVALLLAEEDMAD
jgi:acyl-CoA synthetase (AMP-forming)/AMP-acid ligase II